MNNKQFIELTTENGKVLINMQNIICVKTFGKSTQISFVQGSQQPVSVSESYEQIKELILS